MKKILVIDDDASMRSTITRVLRGNGYCAVEASSAEEGLQAALSHLPDLILSDIMMQGSDGFALLSELHQHGPVAAIPVVLMSGDPELVSTQGVRRGMELGADDFLLKPFSSETLLGTVTARLRKHETVRKQSDLTKARLHEILEATIDVVAMVLAENHRVTYLNQAGRKLFGFGLKEPLGDLSLSKLHTPAAAAWLEEECLATAIHQGVWKGETSFLDPSGQEVPVREVILAHKSSNGQVDFLSVIAHDITKSKHAQRLLQESETRYRTLVSGLPIPLYRTTPGPEGRFQMANPALAQMLGFASVGELMLVRVADLYVDPEEQAAFSEHLRAQGRVDNINLRLKKKDGSLIWARSSACAIRDAAGEMVYFDGVMEDITERTAAEERLRVLTTALEAAANGVAIMDAAGTILWVNSAFTTLTGYAAAEAVGQNLEILHSGKADGAFSGQIWETISAGAVWHGETTNRHKNGSVYQEEVTITPVRQDAGPIMHFIAIKQDITARKKADQDRNRMEVQLRHSQKLESIGQLAAGIAHEINTPTQYIGDNTRFLQDSFAGITRVLAQYGRLLQAVRQQQVTPQLVEETAAVAEAADITYLTEEVPKSIQQTLQGVAHVSKIVRAMKNFSHPGSEEKTEINLNQAIESTVTVARNEWKYVADLDLILDPQLPTVPCLPGEINQVILNLVINAAHAIGDVVGEGAGGKGWIRVSTSRQGDWAEIRVQDTGTGIPEPVRARIFDPFFTTKAVGKGSGQGLTIAHSVVVEQHGGTIGFETEMGKGTTFIVRLPLHPGPVAKERNG